MKQNAGEVMAGRIQSVELTIQGVGKPGEGVPILGVAGVEGPDKSLPGQACLNGTIVGNVVLIVEIDKRMAYDGAVNGRGPEGQKQARENDEMLAFSIHGMVDSTIGQQIPPGPRFSRDTTIYELRTTG